MSAPTEGAGRILTTHVGSLPRSAAVTAGVFAIENEDEVDIDEHHATGAAAVDEVVGSQVAPGVAGVRDAEAWEIDDAIGERSVTAGLYETEEVAGTRLGLAAGPDGTYTDTLARLARMGAALVAIPTHDWAAYTAPHVGHLRLRAAEHRLAIAKADWRYGSVVIAPSGDVVAGTSLDEEKEELLVADLPLSRPGTLYTSSGDWLGVASLGALAAMLVGSVALGVRDRRINGVQRESATRPN